MAVTLLVGPEDSTQNTANNPRDMAANVFELEPNVSPLLALTSKTNSKAATNPKIKLGLR